MGALVLTLLNELKKKDNMQGLFGILLLFATSLINSIIHHFIYQKTLFF